MGQDLNNVQEQKPPGMQNANHLQPQITSDQNQNINKTPTNQVGYTGGQVAKQNNSDGKHHHDQQRLTHEQVIF